MVGVVIWLLACRLPQFAASIELRALVGSCIVTTYTWLAAYEFWRGRDEALVSRWPAIFMLFAHGALFLLRTPLGAMFAHLAGQRVLAERLARAAQPRGAAVHDLDRLHPAGDGQGAHRVPPPRRRRAPTRSPASPTAAASSSRARRRTAGPWTSSRPRCCCSTSTTSSRINDRFGHAVGDRVLQIFAETAAANLPSEGLVGRWGGDEFVAVLYDTGREEAKAAAKRMQSTFQRLAADINGHPVNATLTVGMVFSPEGPLDLPALLVQADEALYLAKELGRNRIESRGRAHFVPQEDDGGLGRGH